MKTTKEGVIMIFDDNEVTAIIYKDPNSRENVFFKCQKMGLEEIASLLDSSNSNEKI